MTNQEKLKKQVYVELTDSIEILTDIDKQEFTKREMEQLHGSVISAIQDAVELLKAQEQKVMTWKEAQANVNEGPFIIFEVRDSTGSGVDFGVLTGDFYEMSEGSVLTVADFWMMKDDYGKRFRLWTSRPDDKRRAETPWTQTSGS